jgi:hypothetical protein
MAWYNPFTWGEGQKVDLDPNLGKLPGADDLRQRMGAEFDRYGGRQAPQAGRAAMMTAQTGQASQLSPQQQAEFRRRQLGLADRLTGIMSGQEQGAGELAAQRQGSRAAAQQMGMARSMRGGNAALAASSAMRNAGDIGLNTAGLSQQAALQDQLMASGQLGAVLGQGRGQDIDMSSQNAQLRQQMGMANLGYQNQAGMANQQASNQQKLANLDAQLRARGMDDQARMATLAQMMGLSQAEMAGQLGAAGLQVENYDPGWGSRLMDIAGQGAVTYATSASDKRSKKNIRHAKDLDAMLERLKPYEYEYKEPDHPLRAPGRRHGVMAQDLEKSELGKAMVKDTPEGKVVNYGQHAGTMMAAIARVHERVAALEGSGK